MPARLGARLLLFAVAVGAAFTLSALVGLVTFERLKVGGDLYRRIVQAQNLRADILPPPEYVIEAYLEATLALVGARPLEEAETRLSALRTQFDRRHAAWLASDLRPDLKADITQGSHAPAVEFWAAVDERLLPALKSGDRAAAARAYNEAADAYARHRAVIDRLVAGAEAMNRELEAEAASAGFQGLLWQGASALIAFGVLAGGVAAVRRGAVRPLAAMAKAVDGLAVGEPGVAVEGTARRDEIGDLARALEAFGRSERERRRLKGEASQARADAADVGARSATDARQALMAGMRPAFRRLSDGDLTVRLDDSVGADFEEMRDLFNRSVARLDETVGAMLGSIAALRGGLSEIGAASHDLASRTETQAASLERTAGSLSEVTKAVAETAGRTERATRAAMAAEAAAGDGGVVIGQAVEAIGEVERSSARIGRIIGLIDEIAFQTNLLALNAGVEAARAGEAGRGFAVVALEVRALAQRSSSAAKEIKDLISTSHGHVQHGVELVTASGRSLAAIVAQVAEMNAMMGEIAAGTKVQAESLRQVSAAADQMERATQQNAAMVEETSAATLSLTQQTEDLARMVRHFRTGGASADGAKAPPAAAPARLGAAA